MIPWRLNIAGIRDFPPQSIDLSGEMDHIGILGPNGSGKSTLSFCMGAVLYSGKVDISGLRSANIPADQLWKASISLLFKNDGPIKIDAPKFIQFDLQIEQTTLQTFTKEYSISSGDEVDEWDEKIIFKSGDKTHNFSTYKKLLQTKYHIDPDYYYLIWYQNEVNQFSEMAPEERFRIFSEMHGIDKIQKNWEESTQLVKEAEGSLEEAKIRKENGKFQLNLQKQKLNLYNDNRKRLKEGFLLYYQALSVLIKNMQNEIERCQTEEIYIQERMEEIQQHLAELERKKTKTNEELNTNKIKRNSLIKQLEISENKLRQLRSKQKEMKSQYEKLDSDLKEITNEMKQIPDESTVNFELNKGKKELEKLTPLIQQQEKELVDKKNKLAEKEREKMLLNLEITRDEEEEIKVKQLLSLYSSSHTVKEHIDKLDLTISSEKDFLKQLQATLSEYKQEEIGLKQNEFYSPRQKEARQYFARVGLEVFTLRDLIRLDESAKLTDERIFNSIKYTMFVNGRNFVPPNDLYYVSLPMIVPERFIKAIEEYHLEIRDDLPESLIPHAVKALCWIQSFFLKNSTIKIQNGILIDEKGWRGPQEEEKYILSNKAILNRLSQLSTFIQEIKIKIEKLIDSIANNENEVKNLRNVVGDIEAAEAFMANKKNRILRNDRYKDVLQQIQEYTVILEQNNQELGTLKESKNKVDIKLELSLEHKRKWEKFAKEKEKINLLRQLEEDLNKMETEIRSTKNYLAIRSEEYDLYNDKCATLEKLIKSFNTEMTDCLNEKKDLNRQLENKRNEKETHQKSYFDYNEEINGLDGLSETKVKEEKNNIVELPNWNISQAKEYRQNAKTTFDHALNEPNIDPLAPENYQKIKEQYDLLAREVNESQDLLEIHKNRMEKLRSDLDSTISGKVVLINQYFIQYIGQFGFDGEIDWEMHEDKKGNIRYYLYLKAKKYGHRMAMEDVSIKARGGRQGVGLSGGEKSLVSLLYALALLQTIQTNPSFIVLDEFDSALDEGRKLKVFDLYVRELGRKMIILTPKSHDKDYLSRFHKAYIIYHRPDTLKSGIMKIKQKKE